MEKSVIYQVDERNMGLNLLSLKQAGQYAEGVDMDDFVLDTLAQTYGIEDGLPLETRLMAMVAKGIIDVRARVGKAAVGTEILMPLTGMLKRNLKSGEAGDVTASLVDIYNDATFAPKHMQSEYAVRMNDRATMMAAGMHGSRNLREMMGGDEKVCEYAQGMAWRALGVLRELKAEMKLRSVQPVVENFRAAAAVMREVFGRAGKVVEFN